MLTTSDWIRQHIYFVCAMPRAVSYDTIEKHVHARTERVFELIRCRVAMGYLRYESNRGLSPCYLEWLEAAVARYKATGNLDALLDASFYAMAEFQNPSKEGTYYDPERVVRDER